MGFTPVKEDESVGKGFTPIAQAKGFTPVSQVSDASGQSTLDPLNNNNNNNRDPGVGDVAAPAFNSMVVQSPMAAVAPAPEAVAPAPGASIFSKFFPSLPAAPVATPELGAPDLSSGARITSQVLDDVRNGVVGVNGDELARVAAMIERGGVDDAGRIVESLAAQMPDADLSTLKDALLVSQILGTERPDVKPGGDASEVFTEALVRGLSLNALQPEVNSGLSPEAMLNPELMKVLGAGERANEIRNTQLRGEHVAADFGGEIVGGVLPFAKGVQLLRAFRAARGLLPVAEGAAGVVAEGAKVGAPLAAAYRPEGSENMSTTEELAARGTQAGVGVVLGGVFDYAGAKVAQKLGPFMSKVSERLKDRALNAALEKEAKAQGFNNVDEYIASATEIKTDDSGAVFIQSKPELIEGLPGVDKPEGDAPVYERIIPELEQKAPEVDTAKIGAKKRVQAQEFERLARATTDESVRHSLLQQARALYAETDGAEAPKMSPKDRYEKNRTIDTESDDLVTAIRKLGGIDTDVESDVRGRLVHLPRNGFGLPGIERPGQGQTLDALASDLYGMGYLKEHDKQELQELLFRAENGDMIYSREKVDYEDAVLDDRNPDAPASSDMDWVWHDRRVDPREVETGFVIDTDSGDIVPSRSIDESDLARLREEELNAERNRQGAVPHDDIPYEITGSDQQSGRLQNAGKAREGERLAGAAEGWPGNQSEGQQSGSAVRPVSSASGGARAATANSPESGGVVSLQGEHGAGAVDKGATDTAVRKGQGIDAVEGSDLLNRRNDSRPPPTSGADVWRESVIRNIDHELSQVPEFQSLETARRRDIIYGQAEVRLRENPVPMDSTSGLANGKEIIRPERVNEGTRGSIDGTYLEGLLEAAVQHVKNGGRATVAELDLGNLGGINHYSGQAGGDKAIADIADKCDNA